ncbi:hypothetical protein G3601_004652 [Salmonella enterica]|uniref:YdaB n=1 Tax=Salmonella enterica subsp. enterica serovar Java TaxID=224729 RepID=A0A3Z6QQX5_SALEB|nr:hypothetical protein [Salmonella enterica subsp. enterica serovar Java]EAO0165761.1 hypothetical protein [Salmonella enterica]ECW2977658.1 hypothetical protein [Salmonella enterica subsp. diarizonae]EDQ0182529.1 hypothetical protein [Salmonella enterica subsp. enterica serovar 4,[5],12:b:-]EEE5612841.1 hypothetical protein [Salmonella enterica subsp. enterica serovar Typhimurium]EGL0768313.1 hypothetical protein [Salmonella enterica subsp. enterica]HCM8913814.1 hypothetical protein [Salmon
MSDLILASSDASVKRCRHTRIRRADIPAKAIDPTLRAFGRHIARSHKKRRGVHIPAMKNGDFGQVLRALELKCAFN